MAEHALSSSKKGRVCTKHEPRADAKATRVRHGDTRTQESARSLLLEASFVNKGAEKFRTSHKHTRPSAQQVIKQLSSRNSTPVKLLASEGNGWCMDCTGGKQLGAECGYWLRLADMGASAALVSQTERVPCRLPLASMLERCGWQATDFMGGSNKTSRCDLRAKIGRKRDSARLLMDTVPSAEAVAINESSHAHFKSWTAHRCG